MALKRVAEILAMRPGRVDALSGSAKPDRNLVGIRGLDDPGNPSTEVHDLVFRRAAYGVDLIGRKFANEIVHVSCSSKDGRTIPPSHEVGLLTGPRWCCDESHNRSLWTFSVRRSSEKMPSSWCPPRCRLRAAQGRRTSRDGRPSGI